MIQIVIPIDWINRNNNLSNITGTKLQSMMNRSISLYIFKYSHHIVSKVNYDFAKKTLIDPVQTDRAGAATISMEHQLCDRLKLIHQQHYETFDFNWCA